MEAYTVCQSCSMPLDGDHTLGTEKDGSPSFIYCKYCYQNGAFIQPDMTLEEMREHLTGLMKGKRMSQYDIDRVVGSLPGLTRWLVKTPEPLRVLENSSPVIAGH